MYATGRTGPVMHASQMQGAFHSITPDNSGAEYLTRNHNGSLEEIAALLARQEQELREIGERAHELCEQTAMMLVDQAIEPSLLGKRRRHKQPEDASPGMSRSKRARRASREASY